MSKYQSSDMQKNKKNKSQMLLWLQFPSKIFLLAFCYDGIDMRELCSTALSVLWAHVKLEQRWKMEISLNSGILFAFWSLASYDCHI